MSDESKPKFPVRVMHKMPVQGWSYWYWSTLCIVYDSEALGILLRLMDSNGIEHREEPT